MISMKNPTHSDSFMANIDCFEAALVCSSTDNNDPAALWL
jgi:hypothetical protein